MRRKTVGHSEAENRWAFRLRAATLERRSMDALPDQKHCHSHLCRPGCYWLRHHRRNRHCFASAARPFFGGPKASFRGTQKVRREQDPNFANNSEPSFFARAAFSPRPKTSFRGTEKVFRGQDPNFAQNSEPSWPHRAFVSEAAGITDASAMRDRATAPEYADFASLIPFVN